MPRAAERSKLPLELGDLRPQDELAVLQHRGDRPLDAVAKLFALRSEVNEGRNGLPTLFAHAISTEALYRILPAESAKSFFFQAEDGIRDDLVTGVQTCALPI